MPPTSLIICSRNRPELLADTVASVLAGDELPAEVVIVDQSDVSRPGLTGIPVFGECNIRHLWIPSVGKAQASNKGVASASHEILVFTDDDVLVTPGWLGTLVQSLVSVGPQSVVTGQVRANEEKAGGFQLTIKAEDAPVVYQGRVGTDVLYGGNMAMYRSAVEEVGGFDPRLGPGASFPAAEDSDLGFRLLEAGFRIVYVPEAVLYHRAWRTGSDYMPLRWSYGVGRGAFYAKHVSLRDRYMLKRLLEDVRTHLLLLFLRRGFHWQRLARGDAALSLGILYGALRWLLTQRKAR